MLLSSQSVNHVAAAQCVKSMMHAKSFRLSFTSYINVEKNHHQWPNVLLTRERPDRFKLAARLRWLKYSFLLVFLTWWAGKHPWGGWSSIAAEDCVDFHSLSRIWRYSWTFEDWKNTATRLADCMNTQVSLIKWMVNVYNNLPTLEQQMDLVVNLL